MIRRLAVVALVALPVYLGCSAPGDERVTDVENTGVTSQALAGGANGKTYYLESFDGTSQFIGLNDQGKSFQGSYGSRTKFRLAALDKFAPTDPCRDPVQAYNDAVSINDNGAFASAFTAMTPPSIGSVAICKAKVHVDKNLEILSFEPMP